MCFLQGWSTFKCFSKQVVWLVWVQMMETSVLHLNKVLWTEAFLGCWGALKSLCPYHVTGFLSPSPEDFIKYSHFKTDDKKWSIRIKYIWRKNQMLSISQMFSAAWFWLLYLLNTSDFWLYSFLNKPSFCFILCSINPFKLGYNG